MYLGAACLNAFVADNWTGPPMEGQKASPLPRHASDDWTGPPLEGQKGSPLPHHASIEGAASKALQEASRRAMEADSEIFYIGATLPAYLRAALTLLVDVVPRPGTAPRTHAAPVGRTRCTAPRTHAWWAARAVGCQQRLLHGRSFSLHTLLFKLWDAAPAALGVPGSALVAQGPASEQGDMPQVQGLDLGGGPSSGVALAHSAYWEDVKSEEALERAQVCSGLEYEVCSGLEYEVTGKIGIRRKFQQNHLAQLVCLANSSKDGSRLKKLVCLANFSKDGSRLKKKAEEVKEEKEEEKEGDKEDVFPDPSGYEKSVGAGVTEVGKNEDCDILDNVRLDGDQGIDEQLPLSNVDQGIDEPLPLSNVDQAILLTRCAWVRRNRARDEMNREQQMALISRVLLHATNWVIFTTSLLSRCRIELTKVQTVDRACLQMQVLVDQYKDEEPAASERLSFAYSVPYPPRWGLQKELADGSHTHWCERLSFAYSVPYPLRWGLQKELADGMMKVGMLRTAADLYEGLGLYKEMVECYVAQDESEIAERKGLGLYKEMVECYVAQDESEIAERKVREQLDKRKTPYMLAVMGYIKEDPAWFEESWELSGKKFAMARRRSRFSAFLRVVQQEPESFESWGNIGAVHMGTSNWEGALQAFEEALKLRRDSWKALQAFEEALKLRRDSWKIWQNLREAAVRLKKWALVLHATGELLAIREKEVDAHILALLVDKAEDPELEGADRFRMRLEKLISNRTELEGADRFRLRLEKLLTAVADDAKVWDVYAEYLKHRGHQSTELECRRKALRCRQVAGWQPDEKAFKGVAGWQSDEKAFQGVARTLTHVVEAYLRDGSAQSLFASKSALTSSIAKSKDSFEDTPEMAGLQELLERVKAAQAAAKPAE
ncbi:hypothetical protein T484DRAFT_1829112 [Baffinella frigidus]|nr:hypothetical protein T484DRAFT_1829112 [Cryptophyta sp. CCMP2293]